MQRIVLSALALVLVAGIFAWVPKSSAQISAVPPILDACLPGKSMIIAETVSKDVQVKSDRRVIDLEQCPVGERIIRDVGVGSVLPLPGESVYAESMSTEGAQVLEVERNLNGTVVLDNVGSELEAPVPGDFETQASGPPECQDISYFQKPYRLYESELWYFNVSTTPNEVGAGSTRDRLLDGGVNIASVRNNCGAGDGVEWGMRYEGTTSRGAGIDSQGNCVDFDGVSVVTFGDLASNPDTTQLAGACQSSSIRDGTWDKVVESNIKFNKVEARWTTDALADSCRGEYGIETVMTHERGHTFGLDHVSEAEHGNLTMSTKINGTCQASENTLGKGDTRGLNTKY